MKSLLRRSSACTRRRLGFPKRPETSVFLLWMRPRGPRGMTQNGLVAAGARGQMRTMTSRKILILKVRPPLLMQMPQNLDLQDLLLRPPRRDPRPVTAVILILLLLVMPWSLLGQLRALPRPLTKCQWQTPSYLVCYEDGGCCKLRDFQQKKKRDILSSTKNSLDYEVVSAALQSLWDDQLLGHRHHSGHGGYHMNYVNTTDDFSEEADGWEDEWWPEAMYGSYQDEPWDDLQGWWEDEWPTPHSAQAATTEDIPPEEQERLREAQQAERVAENLAAEAQRTWADAQRATQAIRRDRGFGASPTSPGSNGTCFQCGGNHFARDCPQRRSFGGKNPGKGYGKPKGAFYISPDELYANFVPKGKGKPKGMRNFWMEAQGMWPKGSPRARANQRIQHEPSTPTALISSWAAWSFARAWTSTQRVRHR